MTLPPALHRVVRVASWMIMIAALAYLAGVVVHALPRLGEFLRREMIVPMVLAIPAYTVLLGVVALGWAALVLSAMPRGRSLRALVAVYGTSQLAKYLPGNVFHLVGRQMLGQGHGFAQKAMAVASVQEGVSVLVACVALSLGAELVSDCVIVPVAKGLGAAFLLAGAVLLLLALAFHRHFGSFGAYIHVPALLGALFCHTLFLVGSAVIVHALAGALVMAPLSFATVLASWCWAYLSGFVTPAAPGGIGVREAAFVALLPQQDELGMVLVLVFAMRVISALGDLLFAAIAFRLGRVQAG
ncbi:hypothetical protein [Magnetospirillum sulfuroxidans]|uniref:Integral membrane protein n=1 Tax=Magnetospirillum sulfuroxidans TaxID=611300 RepID=A0ABS5IEC4_9PROT|nr:hypothetical protein [Magnetospirillum sulfuroxidans]MBR9972779.1 hypothetical protein [Magnetospirillum sulfuroxidans]